MDSCRASCERISSDRRNSGEFVVGVGRGVKSYGDRVERGNVLESVSFSAGCDFGNSVSVTAHKNLKRYGYIGYAVLRTVADYLYGTVYLLGSVALGLGVSGKMLVFDTVFVITRGVTYEVKVLVGKYREVGLCGVIKVGLFCGKSLSCDEVEIGCTVLSPTVRVEVIGYCKSFGCRLVRVGVEADRVFIYFGAIACKINVGEVFSFKNREIKGFFFDSSYTVSKLDALDSHKAVEYGSSYRFNSVVNDDILKRHVECGKVKVGDLAVEESLPVLYAVKVDDVNGLFFSDLELFKIVGSAVTVYEERCLSVLGIYYVI